MASGNATIRAGRWTQTVANGTATFLRAYVRFDGTPTGSIRLLTIQTSAGTNIAQIQMAASGTVMALKTGSGTGTQQGSATGSLSANTWYRVELKLNVNGASSAVEFRLDGVTIASATLDLGTTAQNRLLVGQSVGVDPGANFYFDDAAVNSSDGSDQNDFPGPGKIVLLKPASDAQRDTSWLNGASGTTNLWDAIDNTPPVGVASPSSATTQIRSAATDSIETYTALTGTYAAAGITSADHVTVALGVMNIGDNHASDALVTGLTLTSNPSGSEVVPASPVAAAGTYPTNWATFTTALVYAPSVTLSDGAQIKVRKGSDPDELYVDLLGVYVEYAEPLTLSLGDTATVSEAQAKGVGAAQVDTATSSEALGKGAGQAQADTATASESHASQVSTAQTDTATASDAATLAPGKAIADTATVSEAATAISGGQLALADTATVTDSEAATVGQALADTATVSEGLSYSLGPQTYTLNLADSVTVTDAPSTVLTPTVTTVEGGWIRTRRLSRRLDLALADIVLTSDEHELELQHPPPVAYRESVADRVALTDLLEIEHDDSATRREEEELILALI